MSDRTTGIALNGGAGNVGAFAYNPALNICYYAIGSDVFQFDAATGQSSRLFTAPGAISSLALTPDDGRLIVGLNDTQPLGDSTGPHTGTVLSVPLATVSDVSTFTTWHYNGAYGESGVYDLAVTSDNQVVMTTQYAGSGYVPTHIFSLSTTSTIPAAAFPAQQAVTADTSLIVSNGGRYIFVEQGNDSGAPVDLYDLQTQQVVAYNDMDSLGLGGYNAGFGDLTEATDLIVNVTSHSIAVLDFSLKLVENLSPIQDGTILDAKFSQDGKTLYLWQASTSSILTYDLSLIHISEPTRPY